MSVRKVQRRGRVMWRARVKVGGQVATAFRTRRDDAREAEAELRKRLKEPRDEPARREVHTLESFTDEFINHQKTANAKSEIVKKRQILRDHLLPAFGGLRLDQITTKPVDTYTAGKLRRLAPATVQNHIAVLRRMLNLAHEWGHLDEVPRIRQVKLDDREADFLSFEEAEAYLARSGKWRPFVLVAIRSGLRLGELRGLQWGDVDLDRRRVRVVRAYTQMGWETPKSGHGRSVNLAWDAVEALRQHRPAVVRRTQLVFPGPSGKPLDEKAVYKACVSISRAAKLGRVVSPHKLRHTFASHHAMRGTPLKVIQAWMGHADIRTTMRYAHLSESASEGYADNVAPARGPQLVSGATERVGRGVTTGVTTDRSIARNGR